MPADLVVSSSVKIDIDKQLYLLFKDFFEILGEIRGIEK